MLEITNALFNDLVKHRQLSIEVAAKLIIQLSIVEQAKGSRKKQYRYAISSVRLALPTK